VNKDPKKRAGQGILTTNYKNGGFGYGEVRLYEHTSEGYGTGEFYIDHISRDNLQAFADWAIVQPPEVYAGIESIHRGIEWYLLTHDRLGHLHQT